MLAYEMKSKKDFPTHEKAHAAIRRGVDKYKMDVGEFGFRTMWDALIASAPFLYIQNYHSPLTWTLDPFDSDYIASIDEIVGQPLARQQFFSRSFDAIERICSRVNPMNEWTRNFPRAAPSQLCPSDLCVPPLPDRSL